jgi:hypothetical protein
MRGTGGGRPYTFDVMEMLELRRQGATYSELGRKYGKDHTTIMHSCKKFGVVPNMPMPQVNSLKKAINTPFNEEDRPIVKRNIQDKYAHIFDEPVCEGKTYERLCVMNRKTPGDDLVGRCSLLHFPAVRLAGSWASTTRPSSRVFSHICRFRPVALHGLNHY